MRRGTVPLYEPILHLKKCKTEVTRVLNETNNTIDSLERKPAMTKAEEQQYDKLWFLHDYLEEELDDIDGAISLLSKYNGIK